jgi:hypothetical protein
MQGMMCVCVCGMMHANQQKKQKVRQKQRFNATFVGPKHPVMSVPKVAAS